jgi:hypothetical protein
MKKTLHITVAVVVLIALYFAAAAITALINTLTAQQLCTVMDYSSVFILFAVLLLIAVALFILFSNDETK